MSRPALFPSPSSPTIPLPARPCAKGHRERQMLRTPPVVRERERQTALLWPRSRRVRGTGCRAACSRVGKERKQTTAARGAPHLHEDRCTANSDAANIPDWGDAYSASPQESFVVRKNNPKQTDVLFFFCFVFVCETAAFPRLQHQSKISPKVRACVCQWRVGKGDIRPHPLKKSWRASEPCSLSTWSLDTSPSKKKRPCIFLRQCVCARAWLMTLVQCHRSEDFSMSQGHTGSHRRVSRPSWTVLSNMVIADNQTPWFC